MHTFSRTYTQPHDNVLASGSVNMTRADQRVSLSSLLINFLCISLERPTEELLCVSLKQLADTFYVDDPARFHGFWLLVPGGRMSRSGHSCQRDC